MIGGQTQAGSEFAVAQAVNKLTALPSQPQTAQNTANQNVYNFYAPNKEHTNTGQPHTEKAKSNKPRVSIVVQELENRHI